LHFFDLALLLVPHGLVLLLGILLGSPVLFLLKPFTFDAIGFLLLLDQLAEQLFLTV
jgi:hypothetical protein